MYHYIVDNTDPYNPRLIARIFTSPELAKDFIKRSKLKPSNYDIIDSNLVKRFDLGFTKKRFPKKARIYFYNKARKTYQKQKTYRTIYRRHLRRINRLFLIDKKLAKKELKIFFKRYPEAKKNYEISRGTSKDPLPNFR